jgi:hypothetical protein
MWSAWIQVVGVRRSTIVGHLGPSINTAYAAHTLAGLPYWQVTNIHKSAKAALRFLRAGCGSKMQAQDQEAALAALEKFMRAHGIPLSDD